MDERRESVLSTSGQKKRKRKRKHREEINVCYITQYECVLFFLFNDFFYFEG